MLDPAEPSEFAYVDAVLLREQGDAGPERCFPRAPFLEFLRVHTFLAGLAHGVRSEKLHVIGNRALDPFRLDVGVLMVAVPKNRPLPFDFPGGWRGGQ